MALFFFLLAKAALASLLPAHFVALRPPFLEFPVCSSFSAILQALRLSGITNRSAISLLLFSDCNFLLASLFSPPSCLLPQSLWRIWHELSFLSSCTIRLQWVPGHCFSQETSRLMSWPDGERSSRILQFHVVSLL